MGGGRGLCSRGEVRDDNKKQVLLRKKELRHESDPIGVAVHKQVCYKYTVAGLQ